MAVVLGLYAIVLGILCFTGALICAFADPAWPKGIPAFAALGVVHLGLGWFLIAHR